VSGDWSTILLLLYVLLLYCAAQNLSCVLLLLPTAFKEKPWHAWNEVIFNDTGSVHLQSTVFLRQKASNAVGFVHVVIEWVFSVFLDNGESIRHRESPHWFYTCRRTVHALFNWHYFHFTFVLMCLFVHIFLNILSIVCDHCFFITLYSIDWCIDLFSCTATRVFNKLTYILTYQPEII